jgi:cyclin B
MIRQADINEDMRAILVDWLVQVHREFCLVPETLYLCTNTIDRYWSIADISITKLQLVGIASLFLASKYEEIYYPDVKNYVSYRACSHQEFLEMEMTILQVLNWRMSIPTAYHFLDRFLSLTKALPMTRQAVTYYLEQTLLEHDLLKYCPSMVCASVIILALANPDIPKHEKKYQHKLSEMASVRNYIYVYIMI